MSSLETASPRAGAALPHMLRATLLTAPLLDELTTGFFAVALPLLRDTFHLSYAQAGLLFTFGALSSLLFEPPINLLSDHLHKRIPLLAALLVLVGGYLLAGFATSYLLLALALVTLYPAIGTALGLAQAVLIDTAPQQSERTMTRWTLLAGIGDLLSPLTVGLLASLGLGWTPLCVLASGIWLAALLIVAPQRFPRMRLAHDDAEDALVGMLAGVRVALRDRELLRWVGVILLATMPDEIFLGFAALYLHDQLHADPLAVSFVLGVGMASGMLGLLALERILPRVRGVRLLPGMALVTLAGVVLMLAMPSIWSAALGVCLVHLGAAGWYPLAKAAAYARLPGRSGMVRAIIAIGDPVEIAMPGLVGLIAGQFGLGAAIAFLGCSSLGVLALALLPGGRVPTAR